MLIFAEFTGLLVEMKNIIFHFGGYEINYISLVAVFGWILICPDKKTTISTTNVCSERYNFQFHFNAFRLIASQDFLCCSKFENQKYSKQSKTLNSLSLHQSVFFLLDIGPDEHPQSNMVGHKLSRTVSQPSWRLELRILQPPWQHFLLCLMQSNRSIRNVRFSLHKPQAKEAIVFVGG